jgi:hypothetical protein
MVGSNLRLEKKFLEMHYEMQMRSWTTDPEESDDDLDDDGATAAGGDEGHYGPPGLIFVISA